MAIFTHGKNNIMFVGAKKDLEDQNNENRVSVYNIMDLYQAQEILYADNEVVEFNENEEDNLFGRELRIVLSTSDWCKFQAQPFYQELIQYLDNLKIQKAKGGVIDDSI